MASIAGSSALSFARPVKVNYTQIRGRQRHLLFVVRPLVSPDTSLCFPAYLPRRARMGFEGGGWGVIRFHASDACA
jgi:hypothetical protein